MYLKRVASAVAALLVIFVSTNEAVAGTGAGASWFQPTLT
jgi:hypothetical protein